MTYFKKKIPPHRRAVFQIYGHKTPNMEETATNKEFLSKMVLEIFPQSKNT
jgi:hypothetical protein